jgi:hypothetical protein
MTHFCEAAMAASGEANRVVTVAVMMFTFFSSSYLITLQCQSKSQAQKITSLLDAELNNKTSLSILTLVLGLTEMSHLGKESKCSRCTQVKIVYAEFSFQDRPERNRSYCKDCYDEINDCICDICFQPTSIDLYNVHLLASHTREEMAKQILQRMIDSKNANLF